MDQACALSKETQFTAFGLLMDDSGGCQVSSYMTERRITCSIPACCLFPNDAVGREDMPHSLVWHRPDRSVVSVAVADSMSAQQKLEVHCLIHCLPFLRALQESALCASMRVGLKEGWKATWKVALRTSAPGLRRLYLYVGGGGAEGLVLIRKAPSLFINWLSIL